MQFYNVDGTPEDEMCPENDFKREKLLIDLTFCCCGAFYDMCTIIILRVYYVVRIAATDADQSFVEVPGASNFFITCTTGSSGVASRERALSLYSKYRDRSPTTDSYR
jgi:hypothetical protein